jgi:quinol-cytochrome oxidoreductase complex cytochrome b subunit
MSEATSEATPRGWANQQVVNDDDPQKLPPELRNTLDGRFRRWFLRGWPPRRLLPDTEPIYVRSWFYVAGVCTLASLILLVVTGIPLAVFGPSWWTSTSVGAFFDSLHYWAVELFFLFMFAHFISVFLMGAFRGKRAFTWMLGVLAFFVSVVTALTGFVSLQDFEAQWVATQGKDAVNATGLGFVFNPLNIGEMITMHVLLFPLIAAGIVGVHILWVRRRGVVPPYDALDEHLTAEEGAT